MHYENWEVRGFDRPAAVALCRVGYNPLVAVLLSSRGLRTPAQASSFLRSDAGVLLDPFLIPDMDAAVRRIQAAVANRERVAVYGDYDVDGMTASCLLADCLRSCGLECEIYIPSRFKEGYGMNTGAIDALRARGVGLIVTVDCGITDGEEVRYASALGVDVIVTDHHECKQTLPPAVAVVDPKRPDSAYPNKALAGVGVAFKLACALSGGQTEQMLRKYADLVAIGTVADVVSLQGENRALVRRGLNYVNCNTRPGLTSLIREAGLTGREIRAMDVGFTLAPRLNAAGRMGDTSLALELLMTEDPDRADEAARRLCALNTSRRALCDEIAAQTEEMLGPGPGDGPIILARRGWYQGVLGIVASRLMERTGRPSILISLDDNGVGRGSCRCPGDFNLYEALTQCADLLVNYGGHEAAAGITVRQENIPGFTERFAGLYGSAVKEPAAPTLQLDLEVVKPELLSLDNISAMNGMEPFGPGNAQPRLCMQAVELESVTPVGGGQHTRMRVRKGGVQFDCIFFSTPPEALPVGPGEAADLAFEPSINSYRGRSAVQLVVKDIRKHGEGRP